MVVVVGGGTVVVAVVGVVVVVVEVGAAVIVVGVAVVVVVVGLVVVVVGGGTVVVVVVGVVVVGVVVVGVVVVGAAVIVVVVDRSRISTVTNTAEAAETSMAISTNSTHQTLFITNHRRDCLGDRRQPETLPSHPSPELLYSVGNPANLARAVSFHALPRVGGIRSSEAERK